MQFLEHFIDTYTNFIYQLKCASTMTFYYTNKFIQRISWILYYNVKCNGFDCSYSMFTKITESFVPFSCAIEKMIKLRDVWLPIVWLVLIKKFPSP